MAEAILTAQGGIEEAMVAVLMISGNVMALLVALWGYSKVHDFFNGRK